MRELPGALPPGDRTIGQLIAETIRAYGNQFFKLLPLGLPFVVEAQVALGRSPNAQTAALLALAPLFALAFVVACHLVLGGAITWRAFATALALFLPVPFLERVFVLPALAWLALVGLAVPATMLEGLGFRAAVARGRRLGTADFVHSFGSLCGLAIVVALSELTLILLLRTQGDNGARLAHALADLVLTPLLYVGGALLYHDQAARIGSRRSDRRRRRDAHLHPPLDADAAGRPDTQVEP
jgi:hypothetical protein